MILADLCSHAVVTVPILWRGAPFIVLSLAPLVILAIKLRRADIVAFALPSLGMVTLHAVTTHNIPRYNVPAEAVAIVGVMFVVYYLVAMGLARFQHLWPSRRRLERRVPESIWRPRGVEGN